MNEVAPMDGGAKKRPSSDTKLQVLNKDQLDRLAGRYLGTKKCVAETKSALNEAPPSKSEFGEGTLLLENFRGWYEIIKNDDSNAYDQLKKEISKDELNFLINGKFHEANRKRFDDKPGDFTRPILLACVFGANALFEKFVEDGADPMVKGTGNSNCVHALVITAGSCPRQEDDVMEIYKFLMDQITHAQRLELLQGEDDNNFRPLELAAKLQTFGLFQLIVETEELYIVQRGERGLYKMLTYDISEYETFQNHRREMRSPLRMLVYVESKNVERMVKYNMHRNALMKKWMSYKVTRNTPFVVAWFIIRLFFLICLIAVDPAVINVMSKLETCRGYSSSQVSGSGAKFPECEDVHGDSTTTQFNIAVAQMLFVCGVFIFFDILECIIRVADPERRRAYSGLGLPIVRSYMSFTYFYRLVMFTLNTICLLTAIFAMTNGTTQTITISTIKFMKALYIPLILLSFLYIVELIPAIGLFAIVLQRMIAIMAYFICISIVVKLVFQIGYFRQIYKDELKFNDTANGLYTMFLLENGVGDLGDILPPPDGFAYVSYFYLSSVLLINYLIAAMSVEADVDADVRIMVQWLRRVDAAYLCEERFGRWLWKLIYYCRGPPKILLNVYDTIYD